MKKMLSLFILTTMLVNTSINTFAFENNSNPFDITKISDNQIVPMDIGDHRFRVSKENVSRTTKTTPYKYGPTHQVRKGDSISYSFSSTIHYQIKYGIPSEALDLFMGSSLSESFSVTHIAPQNGRFRVAFNVRWSIEKGTIVVRDASGVVIKRSQYEIWIPKSYFTQLVRG